MVRLPVEDQQLTPPSGIVVSTFDSVQGVEGWRWPIWARAIPGPGHVVGVVRALRLVLIEGVRPAVFELVEGERPVADPDRLPLRTRPPGPVQLEDNALRHCRRAKELDRLTGCSAGTGSWSS